MTERIALVTGASSGIGAATAKALARDGAAVALLARRESRLHELATDIERAYGVETHVLSVDVTDHDAVEAAVSEVVEVFGGLDVLVNNAGVLRMSDDIVDLSIEEYRTQMAVNCDGMFYATRAALPHLRESRGTIVFIGSDSAKHADPVLATYGATKWWTRGFAKNLEAREGRNGIGVVLVNPGDTRTEIEFRGERLVDTYDPDDLLAPEDVAQVVAFAARQDGHVNLGEIDVSERSLYSDIYQGLTEDDEETR